MSKKRWRYYPKIPV